MHRRQAINCLSPRLSVHPIGLHSEGKEGVDAGKRESDPGTAGVQRFAVIWRETPAAMQVRCSKAKIWCGWVGTLSKKEVKEMGRRLKRKEVNEE